MMKILLLSDPNSSHTLKWHDSLVKKGLEVQVWGFDYSKPKLLQVSAAKKILKEYKPDILHAHYASSYGLIGSLLNFKPFILSVWGSDVFEFPRFGIINKLVLQYNFYKADKILSTSNIMAKEVQLYTNKDIEVIPFGVDTDFFKPIKKNTSILTIGIIKSLKKIYAIDYALKAFSIVLLKNKKIKFLVVGSGTEEKKLKLLVKKYGISKHIEFVGNIDYNNIVNYHNKIDIFLNISLHESFGVSVLEASACEKPVIVSNVGGLKEVVEDGVTGIIVPPKDSKATAKAIEKLVNNEKSRADMGYAGRQRVKSLYEWDDNVMQIINIYREVLK